MVQGLTGALLVLDGAPASASLRASLARDAIDLEPLQLAALDTVQPPALVVVLMPAGTPAALLARLVAWRDAIPAKGHLIGCVPDGDAEDSVRALAAGFDDVMAGRHSPRELSARLRAIVRRDTTRARPPATRLKLGRMVLDVARHELWVEQRRVALTALELAAMEALMGAQGRTLTREELLDRVWGEDDLDVGLRAVDNLICRLRRKLGDRSLLVTIRGVGFRLREP